MKEVISTSKAISSNTVQFIAEFDITDIKNEVVSLYEEESQDAYWLNGKLEYIVRQKIVETSPTAIINTVEISFTPWAVAMCSYFVFK